MRFLKLAVVCGFAAFASACGTSGMGPGDGGGGGGGGTNPTPASVTVSNTATGTFSVAISTSFQPADWDYQFFQLNPTATTTLGNLGSRHVRLQGIVHGVPQGSEGTSSTAWDFSMLDAITQPVLGTGDHSPEFQIAKAPAFMYSSNNSGSSFVDTSFTEFAGYAQNLVRYYNTGGFTANGRLYDSPAFANNRYKVTWWGIYNEPSINNNLDADLYTTMYNAVVPAMQQRKQGSVVNISSNMAFNGGLTMMHYVTSKAAVVGFSRVLARELGPDNIRVNTLAPGATMSEEKATESALKNYERSASTRILKRIEQPEDLVGTALYLLSDLSTFVTGQTILVNGGAVLH